MITLWFLQSGIEETIILKGKGKGGKKALWFYQNLYEESKRDEKKRESRV